MNERRILEEFLTAYSQNVVDGLFALWDKHVPDTYKSEGSDAIAGLLARQATLAIEFARNPGIWNGNMAPLVLRAMTDAHITFAWILADPAERGRLYISYGIGQEKLQIELLDKERDLIPEDERNTRLDEMLRARRDWIGAQIAEWAIDVNIGSWSGKSTREMAKEADCDSLYKFAYMPFSGAAHSMWQHVGLYNVETCRVALHKFHRMPRVLEIEPDLDYLYRSAKYVSRTYRAFAEKYAIVSDVPLPVDFFQDNVNSVGDRIKEAREEDQGDEVGNAGAAEGAGTKECGEL